MGNTVGRLAKRKLDVLEESDDGSRPSPYNPDGRNMISSGLSSFNSPSTLLAPTLPRPCDDPGSGSRPHPLGGLSPSQSTLSSSNPSTPRAQDTVDSADCQVKLSLSDKDAHSVDLVASQVIARGGFCEVYIACHRPTGLKLAMKRPISQSPTLDMLRRFRREAEVWATLEHVSILPFFGTIEIGDHLYLASPWMEQGDLLTFAQKRSRYFSPVDPQDLVVNESDIGLFLTFTEHRAIREIAAGIAYLHSLDIIHGDIKARNVLLDSDGCAKICDLGLTKTTFYDATSSALKGVGSIRWQSPELLHSQPKTPKSDIYAFAMTIVEILTCDYPFPDLEPAAFLCAIVVRNERPEPQPRKRLDVVFDHLWDLAAWCWESEAKDRPSAKEALQLLDLEADRARLSLSVDNFDFIEFTAQAPVASGQLFDLFVGLHRPTQLKLQMKRLNISPLGLGEADRLRKEAGNWAELIHPNVLPFFGLAEARGDLYVIFPWITPGNLRTFLNNYTRYLESDDPSGEPLHLLYSNFKKIRTIREVASGLAYLHSRGVAHGRLSASNVLIDEEGYAKICDFGYWDPLAAEDPQEAREFDISWFGYLVCEILEPKCPSLLYDWSPGDLRPPGNAGHNIGYGPLLDLVYHQCWKAEPSERSSMAQIKEQLDAMHID